MAAGESLPVSSRPPLRVAEVPSEEFLREVIDVAAWRDRLKASARVFADRGRSVVLRNFALHAHPSLIRRLRSAAVHVAGFDEVAEGLLHCDSTPVTRVRQHLVQRTIQAEQRFGWLPAVPVAERTTEPCALGETGSNADVCSHADEDEPRAPLRRSEVAGVQDS